MNHSILIVISRCQSIGWLLAFGEFGLNKRSLSEVALVLMVMIVMMMMMVLMVMVMMMIDHGDDDGDDDD